MTRNSYQDESTGQDVDIWPGITRPGVRASFTVDNGDCYGVYIENASKSLDREEEDREFEMFEELYRKRADLRASTVGDDFLPPPPLRGLRLQLQIEIVSAHNFVNGGIYIQYMLDFPDCWEVWSPVIGVGGQTGPHSRAGEVTACTQIVDSAWDWQRGGWFAALGYSVEAVAEVVAQQHDARPTPYPILYLQVCSVDTWQKYRVEGYGQLRIPTNPGDYDLDIATWRPLPRPAEKMQEHFLGGMRILEDISWVRIPAREEVTVSGVASIFA
ncbi:Pleiotropic negative transcriptional regulator [Gonapodya sp. JEL0774]|nr:Pleiotropic negative transcriptional regulator [Gonapodya sp. JEL0774]